MENRFSCVNNKCDRHIFYADAEGSAPCPDCGVTGTQNTFFVEDPVIDNLKAIESKVDELLELMR